jgi:hypothetical protein
MSLGEVVLTIIDKQIEELENLKKMIKISQELKVIPKKNLSKSINKFLKKKNHGRR